MPRQYEPSELILAAALRESVAGRIWHPSTQVHRSGGGGASWKGGGGERGERGERGGLSHLTCLTLLRCCSKGAGSVSPLHGGGVRHFSFGWGVAPGGEGGFVYILFNVYTH